MTKAILLIITALGLSSFAFAQGKDLISSVDKLTVYIQSLGRPSIRSGMSSMPITLGINNNDSGEFSLDSVFVRLSTINSSGIATELGSSIPKQSQSNIKANQTTLKTIQIQVPILSSILNIGSIFGTKKFRIEATPKVNGINMSTITKEFSMGGLV